MAGNTVDLVVRVLADTSSAHASFTSMGKDLGALLGSGAGGSAVANVVQASADFQSSMSKIQQAYNSVDFAPGTQNYVDASSKVLQLSGTMATSFEQVAASMAQGSKITDQYGNKLPIDKVNEFVDANLRLKASSQDSVDALTSGQHMAMLDKMFSSTDYKGTASMVAALSTQHPQDEETLWQAALGIGKIGAPLGVTMPQALGLGNYLSDVGGGGMTGGASIGRMLLRMDTSADQVLDPVSKYADVKRNRDAQEKLDDLQTSLAEAEAKRGEMFGQHGLKTQYMRHPSALMAEDDRIAKLNREIIDQRENIAHENDPNRSRPRGQMRMDEMAKTAGMDSTAYAELFKADPITALLNFTSGLHDLAAENRAAAMTRAGIVNVKDQTTISLLSDQPGSVRRMIAMAESEQAHPTAIDQISNVGLSTTNAKLDDLHNTLRAGVVSGGEPLRREADKGLDNVTSLIASGNWGDLEKKIGESAGKFDQLNGALSAFSPVISGVELMFGAALPGILKNVFTRGGPAAGAGTAGEVASGGAVTAGGLGAAALTSVGAVIGGGLAVPIIDNMKAELDAYGHARQVAGQGPIQINIGDVHASGQSSAELLASVTAQLTAAWNASMKGTPVAGAVGGNYSVRGGPRN